MSNSPSLGLQAVQLPMVSSFRTGTTGSPEQRSHVSTPSSRTTITPALTPPQSPVDSSSTTTANLAPASSDTSLRAGESFAIATTSRRDSPDFFYTNKKGRPVYRAKTQDDFLLRAAIIIGKPEIFGEQRLERLIRGPSPFELMLEEGVPALKL